MPRAAILCLPQPCPERWDAMTPTGAGRHCAACQKVVVDFTHKTDAELLAYFTQASSSTCGRFRAEQLARPLRASAPRSRWRGWLASVLAVGGVLSSSRAAAQAGEHHYSAGPTPLAASPSATQLPTPTSGTAEPAATSAAAPASTAGAHLIRGVVTDAETGERLPGAMVLVAGTTRGAMTDAQGEFTLDIAAPAATQLLISSVGYSHEQLTALASATSPLAIALHADHTMLGGEVVITNVGRRPWPWHPRALYYRAKYLLLRPFR